jgi:AP-2 complex subunit alpha
LGKFISVKEPNIRYLGLEALGRFAQTDISDDSIKKHMGTVMISLRDADVRYADNLKRSLERRL